MKTNKRKILFLGETYRADAITWMNGLKEFGDFEIVTWELKTPSCGIINRVIRLFEYTLALSKIKKIIASYKPEMVIAERTTSYGFLAVLTGIKPVVIAQQGITDLWPSSSILLPLKRKIQDYAFKKADLIHAWGPVMTVSMRKAKVDMNKVLVLAKGIDLSAFENKNTASISKINAIVTRSLSPEYRHDVIIKSFAILHGKGFDFELTIVGDGVQLSTLKELAKTLQIDTKINFTGKIPNTQLPQLLQQSNFYISMPITEGVSASLFEAMATNCYPIVTDIPGNQSWIRHRENGQLIAVDDYKMLASELIWAKENPALRNEAIEKNRKFVEENADYKINMKIIADRYHELIKNTKKN
ncbi:glycosyltransferase family 4 protein [Flavobacterium psychrotolerans]|uniref:Glycosyl transferase family 1 n=1 Tax=Flavobacterium psychrotolerans TaxID=2169410 RepID=A0A2U1JQG8_9FLAO|nr:glycosyltransferase [Flavobacterium psychrotolerans]PWA07224.1 glycosyl transferase family 1 [Flavobacterium psychrotolerans]